MWGHTEVPNLTAQRLVYQGLETLEPSCSSTCKCSWSLYLWYSSKLSRKKLAHACNTSIANLMGRYIKAWFDWCGTVVGFTGAEGWPRLLWWPHCRRRVWSVQSPLLWSEATVSADREKSERCRSEEVDSSSLCVTPLSGKSNQSGASRLISVSYTNIVGLETSQILITCQIYTALVNSK